MTISKTAVVSLAKKIIELTEKELKAGKHEGNEKQVKEILDTARKLTSDKED
jgi:hypothetical protein